MNHDGLTCQDRFHRILALENTDPELQALHFLTVAAYSIQHPAQFADDAIAGLRQSFSDYLDGRITIEDIKQRNRVYNGPRRVLKSAFESIPVLRGWKMTTADVYLPRDPKGAAARVKQWAESVKSEL